VYAYVLQVIIAANHMSGKDTHVRGLRILGAVEYVVLVVLFLQISSLNWTYHRDHAKDGDPFPFESLEYKMYETIR
jgi:anaphase-promoting complex subunit 10